MKKLVTIKVSEETRKILNKMKYDKDFSTIDALISTLIKFYKLNKNG